MSLNLKSGLASVIEKVVSRMCRGRCASNVGGRVEGEVWHVGCVWYISGAVYGCKYLGDGCVLSYEQGEGNIQGFDYGAV